MAVDCCEWYPLPEVSPTEGRWWEKENTKPFYDVRVQGHDSSPSSTPSCLSESITTATDSDEHQAAAELSISSLHTATPLTANTSSIRTPNYGSRWTASEFSSETVQSLINRPRGGVSDHRVKFAAHLEPVTEIDELWRRFQASSLVGKENGEGSRCTCGGKSHTVKKRESRMKDSKTGADSMKSSSIPRVKRSVLVERAIQTSPMPHPLDRGLPHPHTHIPRSASVAFSVASPSRPARPWLGQMTLSEAFALSHPEFIEASLRRQRELRERRWDHLEYRGYYATGKGFRKPHSSTSASVHTHHPLRSVGVASPGWHLQRPKISKRDMYEASKRAWSQLPEVKAKALAEKRKSQAETNRLRVKLYQKEVLSRLRKQNKQKHWSRI